MKLKSAVEDSKCENAKRQLSIAQSVFLNFAFSLKRQISSFCWKLLALRNTQHIWSSAQLILLEVMFRKKKKKQRQFKWMEFTRCKKYTPVQWYLLNGATRDRSMKQWKNMHTHVFADNTLQEFSLSRCGKSIRILKSVAVPCCWESQQ